MEIDRIVANVPDYKSFLNVDELDASTLRLKEKYPKIVEVFEAGKSREGHPILCLKIGSGDMNALCMACPHPNEPIGAMTLEYLSEALAQDDSFREGTNYTWYIIKCVDPDGTRLNEGWFKGPFTMYSYMRNYFRPSSDYQVEWTFPTEYKNLRFNSPMPETQAIMRVIERAKPEFLYSLHNGGLCGAYWYITHEYEELYALLRKSALKQGIPLKKGEPESPACVMFSDAVYKMAGISEEYDYIEKYTSQDPVKVCVGGTCSSDYALKYNDCVTLLTELPYFGDERVNSDAPSDITRRDALKEKNRIEKEHYAALNLTISGVRSLIGDDNPFIKLVDQISDGLEASHEAEENLSSEPEYDRIATVSEAFDSLIANKFYNSLSTALVLRACEREFANCQGVERVKLGETVKALEERLKYECNNLEKELKFAVIPIQKLVRVQLESGLLTAAKRAGQKEAGNEQI